jgi:HlyD family secretion protein
MRQTNQHRSENTCAKMKHDELIYQNILANMSDGVMTIGLDGLIITFNDAAEKILQMKTEDVIGRPFGELFLVREGNDDFNQIILNAVYESETIHNGRVDFYTDDQVMTLNVTTSFLKADQNGRKEKAAVIVVFSDMTEMERMRSAEIKLTEQIKEKHKELQDSYLKLEDSNTHLETALKKVQIIRIAATAFVILLFLAIGIFTWIRTSATADRTEARRAESSSDTSTQSVYTVAPQMLTDNISLKGSLRPIRVVNVPSPFTGNVKDMFFEYGQPVTRGQLLLKLDKTDAETKYREARAAFIKANEKYREVTKWETSDEVIKVRRSLAKAKMSFDTQKRTLQETEYLFKKGIVPATEYENAKQQHINAQLDHEAAEQEMKTVLAKGRGDNYNVVRLEMENTKSKLAEMERQLSLAEITAPVSGTIVMPDTSEKDKSAKPVAKGASFTQGEILLAVADTEGLSVKMDVDEIEVLKIRRDQEATITGEAFPGIELKGRVAHVSAQAGSSEGKSESPSFKVGVTVDKIAAEIKEKIRLGMSANVVIVIFQKPQALLIPIRAVSMEGNNRFVTLRDKGTKALKKIPVETGITTSDAVEILKGLNAGDEVMVP